MNSKRIFIFYFISLSSFILTTFFYVPLPRLNQVTPNHEKNDEIEVKEVYLNKDNLNNRIKRRINVGNSYMLAIDDEISLTITNLAFWNKKNLNLSYYSKYLPELIIDKDSLKIVNKNNYGIKNTDFGRKYQACLFDFKNPYFIYQSNTDEIVKRYNDLKHWRWVIKKEIWAFFSNFRIRNFSCLLLTTSNREIFEDKNKNILQIISKNFVFE